VRASPKQLAALVVTAIRSQTFDFYGAVATMAVALVWRLGQALTADPQILVDVPLALGFVLYCALLFAAVGALAFVLVQAIIVWLRWCLREKISPGKAWTAIISAAFGLIFFALPDFCDALLWWHKHLLRALPHEEQLVAYWARAFHANHQTIFAVSFFGLLGSAALWPVFSKARQHFRSATSRLTTLTRGRYLRVPAVLVIVTILALGLTVIHRLDLFIVVLFINCCVLLVWLFLRELPQFVIAILLLTVLLVPGAIVNLRIGNGTWGWYFAVATIWGAVLFWSLCSRPWPWRIVSWVGVFAFAIYIVQ